MASQGLILLVIFLSECYGHTKFIYTTKDEVKLFCNTNKWQISTESDNKMDVSCTVECVPGDQFVVDKKQKSCLKKDSRRDDDRCHLMAGSGFYRCVNAFDSGFFLYPFNSSRNTARSYVVAAANENITTESVKRSSVQLEEGEDLLLNCSFVFTPEYDNRDFTLYWIKTVEKRSNCVYSYDYLQYSGIRYNLQCDVQEPVHRLWNYTEDRNKHNVRISNLTGSDAGQYLCALHVNTGHETERGWKIVNNITVNVHKKGHRKNKESENAGGALTPLYATIPILLAVVVAAVVFLWKKTKTSPGSQVIKLQRHQHGDNMEETADEECSPYAIGSGGEEITFRSKMDDLKREESKDIYSVVKKNDLYEPGFM